MNPASRAVEYCRRDTEITGKFVATMIRKYAQIGCELKTTIAATTLNYFETAFYGGKITHPFTEKQIDWFHEGYYGGRTEIFHNLPIEGNIYYHDLNSLYPYCLKTGKFPKLEDYYATKKPDLSLEGIATVQIQAPETLSIPYLPCKHENRLVFPLGQWRGVYTYFELREAQKLGYRILKYERALEFPSCFNPFQAFIDTIYGERLKAQKQGDELMSQVFKAFGNFAYGKYAQKNETVELVPIQRLREIPDGTTIFGDLALIKRKGKYPRYANCVWASYTTAYARHRLYSALTKVTENDGLLLYCDTDSVIYEKRTQILEDSRELGDFKLEGRFKYAHFKLPKLYCLIPYDKRDPKGRFKAHTYRAKGVPRPASKRFFKNSKARFKKPNKLRETLRRNLSPNRKYKIIPNYWEIHEKEIRGKYEKRIVNRDGSTTPLILKGIDHGFKTKKKTECGNPIPPGSQDGAGESRRDQKHARRRRLC